LTTLAKWRGRDVLSEDGEKLGSLEAVVYDYKTGAPLWIGFGSGIFHPRMLLAPVQAMTADGSALRIASSKDQVINEPPIELGEGWSYGEDAKLLYEYFGLDFGLSESDDIRVLHRHSELPGGERVIGGGAGSP
jgi:hypothetical protein